MFFVGRIVFGVQAVGIRVRVRVRAGWVGGWVRFRVVVRVGVGIRIGVRIGVRIGGRVGINKNVIKISKKNKGGISILLNSGDTLLIFF
jgi:hypothetical protein